MFTSAGSVTLHISFHSSKTFAHCMTNAKKLKNHDKGKMIYRHVYRERIMQVIVFPMRDVMFISGPAADCKTRGHRTSVTDRHLQLALRFFFCHLLLSLYYSCSSSSYYCCCLKFDELIIRTVQG